MEFYIIDMVQINQEVFPRIKEDDVTYTGGDQNWYYYEWQRWAGCGSVCGANLAAYYHNLLNNNHEVFNKDDYVKRMREMYKYMTPGIHGFPDPNKFKNRFIKYQNDHGYDCTGEVYSEWETSLQAREYMINQLSGQTPLALLILKHDYDKIQENTWHWMTIIGVDEEKNTFLISNHGLIEEYEIDPIFTPKQGNQVWLVSFSKPELKGDKR